MVERPRSVDQPDSARFLLSRLGLPRTREGESLFGEVQLAALTAAGASLERSAANFAVRKRQKVKRPMAERTLLNFAANVNQG